MEFRISMSYVKLLCCIGAFFFVKTCFAIVTYIPASIIAMTGSNNEVFFDVEDEIENQGTTIVGPRLSTITKSFSGAFYLSGAGWVDLGAGGYGVYLDCGIQPLNALTSPCALTGTGYGELIGEVVFGGNVKYHPGSGLLSGSATTFLGEYDFSGIMLPLLPAVFSEGIDTIAHHDVHLSISGGYLYGNGAWTIGFTPITTADKRNISPEYQFIVNLTLATGYDVEITDPQGSKTLFEYNVKPNIPSFTLYSGLSYRSDFCSRFPLHVFCQDGDTQKPSEFLGLTNVKVANGSDPYNITLSLRDTYGNEIKEGDISLMYKDAIRTFQVNRLEYFHVEDYCARNMDDFCALITTGPLLSNDDGAPDFVHIPVIGGISYSISSRAPTGIGDTLTLSGISYRGGDLQEHDIFQPSLATPLQFSPWYLAQLTSSELKVGEVTEFTSTLVNNTPGITPDTVLGVYHIDIGSNSFASYLDFLGDNITCTKYVGESGIDFCNWVRSPDTSIVSTWGPTFFGVYTPYSGHPDPENVAYQSFIRYTHGGTTVIYPSTSESLGMATAGVQYMKILGQDTSHNFGVEGDKSLATTQWNSLKKSVKLKSRGRTPGTGYSDVDYIIHTGSITVQNADLNGANRKRTIVSFGGDITINENITSGENSTVLIALMDDAGSGGNIVIAPSVTDLSTSLFAEKSIRSSGDNQLYIFGNLFSHNTLSETKCPYYVTGVCNPLEYNLELIRADYLDLLEKTGHTAMAPRATEYLNTPIIIEYDGRLIQNPPPILEK